MCEYCMNDHFTENKCQNGTIFLSYTSIELVLPNAFDDMYTRMIDGNICEMQYLLPL